MKLTKEELKNYYEQGKTQVFNYKRAYQIEYSSGTSGHVLRELERYRIFNGLSYTKRGRYVAYNIEQANKLIKG